MSSLEQQINLISSHRPIIVKDGQVVATSYWKHFLLWLCPKTKNAQIAAVHAHAIKILNALAATNSIEKKVICFRLARAVLQRYKGSSGLAARLDQCIVKKRAELWPHRAVKAQKYQIASNQKNLKRWLGYGFAQDFFVQHNDCANFLLKTHIASAMAMWSQHFLCVNNTPLILYRRTWIDWRKVRDFIRIVYHPDSQSYRLYDKRNGKAMEYLGAGQGLVHCHRHRSAEFPVVSKIEAVELEHIQSLGNKYVRPGEAQNRSPNPSRTHVLQIVSSQTRQAKTAFSKIFTEIEHPFIRLISPDGKIKVISYMKYNHNHNILSQGKGQISSPDFMEQMSNITQYITNISITEKEAEDMESLCLEMRNEDLVFNMRGQNCTTFIKFFLKKFHLAEVPEGRSLFSILQEMLTGSKSRFTASVLDSEHNALVRTVCTVFRCISHLFLKPLLLLLGEVPFRKFGANSSESWIQWIKEPILLHLPSEIKDWQLLFASTEKVLKNKRVLFSSLS